MNPLPVWLLWAQALALPAIALAIAGIGAWLAWQQVEIARIKLQHELFDRRFAVYDAARQTMVTALCDLKVSQSDLSVYWSKIADSVFLLDDDLPLYLDSISMRIVSLNATSKGLEAPVGDQQKLAEAQHDHLLWLHNQLPVLVERFKPFLQLDKRKRSARNSRRDR